MEKNKLLLINSVCGTGSTGRLCVDIAKAYDRDGYEVRIAYGRHAYVPEDAYDYAVRIGSDPDVYVHVALTRLTDKHGLFSRRATREFLEWADEFDPDILWMHNIHGYYVNYEMLFDWIRKRPDMKVKWTLHDCWSFTGHCAYFTYAGCNKWIADPKYAGDNVSGCANCPQKRSYPASWFADASAENYLRKRKAFTGIGNLSLVTPSIWLKNLVQKSFLSEYPVQVVYNHIDTDIFKPTESGFRNEHGISKKAYMILGVANVWDRRKGLEDFISLYRRICDDSASGTSRGKGLGRKVQIVLVGLNDKQLKKLPAGIIGLPCTRNAKELAGIYTAADVVVNPTYEDNYPSVILEAEACGTPVITYDTGGCAEAIHISGSKAIPSGIDSLEKEILHRI